MNSRVAASSLAARALQTRIRLRVRQPPTQARQPLVEGDVLLLQQRDEYRHAIERQVAPDPFERIRECMLAALDAHGGSP